MISIYLPRYAVNLAEFFKNMKLNDLCVSLNRQSMNIELIRITLIRTSGGIPSYHSPLKPLLNRFGPVR